MSAVLAKCLQDIIRKVEKISAKKVRLVEKRGMNMPVIVKVARPEVPAHLLYFDPTHGDISYHSIAHECVHILRLFEAEPGKRIVPIATSEMRDKALEMIEAEIEETAIELTDDMARKMQDFWYDSIIRQLSNYPVDIRIEQWLYKYYPELRPVQSKAIKMQADAAAGSLKDEVQDLTPPMIYEAANVMNYAYLTTLGKFLETAIDLPFRASQFAEEGKKLVAITDDSDRDDHEGDVEMIQHWADFLGLSDWFAWMDFESVPA
ncbi:MAG: hypothetical protein H6695_19145 [Deferribacteres bacterium]|nr:hypothetical protein [Deferribacteres bacterium]